ncbi:MAG: M56 and MltD domain-containing protein [Bdellovibrionota bacterium]
MVPENLISDPTALRLAIRHELQHHRQRDTHTVHLVELARALFFWNPGYHAWANALARLQEFACDEALIGRQSVSPQAYGRCLFQVAEIASGSRRVHAGTTGMATGTSGSILKRRIEMILSMKSRKKGSLMMVGLAMGTALAVGGASLATGGVIQERKLTMEEARTYAENAARQTVIPIDLNDLVLARLNYFIGTAEGRDHVQRAFHRMPLYKRMIEALTKRYELPEELIAIPFFESAFDNSRISSMLAAGIWQFIPSTALTYDLVVNPREDDRFDPVKETHAAMKYYRDLWNRFGDWRLAIKSYNEGESRVEKLMAKLGTRDPWVLERAESMEDYLPGAIATLIILKNPELMR